MSALTKKFNPWPFAIIAYFAVFIAGIVGFVIFATRQKMDLVRADYYDEEIRFQEQIDRANRTKSLNAPIAIRYDASRSTLFLSLPTTPAQRVTKGRVQLYRPSDARLDLATQLTLGDDGVQQLDAKKLKPGLWKVRVLWELDGQEYFFDKSIVIPPHPS